jgi:hypothetical protein
MKLEQWGGNGLIHLGTPNPEERICTAKHGGHSPELSWAECDECPHEVFNEKQAQNQLHLLCCDCLRSHVQSEVEKAMGELREEISKDLDDKPVVWAGVECVKIIINARYPNLAKKKEGKN